MNHPQHKNGNGRPQKASVSELELARGILDQRESWHHDYKDQAYIYIGNLNKSMTEGDLLTVFSQFGVPVDLKLVRDKNSGESLGFAFLKYEDQRSTILAVDNLNRCKIGGSFIKVDHVLFDPDNNNDEDLYNDYKIAIKSELERDLVNNK